MRKTLILATLFAGSLASAQTGKTWEADLGTYTFRGCERSGTNVVCSLSYSQSNSDSHTLSKSAFELTYYKPDGTTGDAQDVAIVGKWEIGGASATVGRDIPISVQFRFPYPNSATTIRRLILIGQRFDNVPIKGAQPAPKPVTNAAAASTSTGLSGTYAATLTNCKVSGAVTTCTITFKR